MKKASETIKTTFDDPNKQYQISGTVVSHYLQQAMRRRDFYMFKQWFELIGNDPNAINRDGYSIWMLWNKEVRQYNQSLDQAENAPFTNLLRELRADDCDFLLKLYARGGVALLLEIARQNYCDINARNALGLRVLDYIALPTFLGKVYGEEVKLCSNEDVARLREAGFRFGYKPFGEDTIWCRARTKDTDDLAPYWNECVQDALELGISEETKFAVVGHTDEEFFMTFVLQYIPEEIDYGENFEGYYDNYLCDVANGVYAWGSEPISLKRLQIGNALLQKAHNPNSPNNS